MLLYFVHTKINLVFLILGVVGIIRGRISKAIATGHQRDLNKRKVAKYVRHTFVTQHEKSGLTCT